MVLKFVTSIVFVCAISFVHDLDQGPLLENYKQKITKQLKSCLKQDVPLQSFENLNFDLHNLEAYRISSKNVKGYLFIKEVKACSLNGCTSKSTISDQLNSEYYDISVLVDEEKTIQSIKILDYFSDYGYEITSKRYLKKYVGKNLCDFSNSNYIIDGISGATISYNGLINSMSEFCELTP